MQSNGHLPVIVIGAGIAGLAAAVELRRQNLPVIILEARDRIGGRIWTKHWRRHPVELGAALIHRRDGNPITSLARRLGLRTQAVQPVRTMFFDAGGCTVPTHALWRAYKIYDRTLSLAKSRHAASRQDISIAEGMRQAAAHSPATPHPHPFFQRAEEDKVLDTAEDMCRLSLAAWDEDEEFSGPDAYIPRGYGQIVRFMARGLDIRLDQRVEEISLRKDEVAVRANSRWIRGSMALVTVPLGVLKSGIIRFSPGLPRVKVNAIKKLGVGELDKIVLSFSRRFWPAATEYLSFVDPQRKSCPEFLNQHRISKSSMLIGLWGGDMARNIIKRSDADILDSVLSQLRNVFGTSMPDPVGHLITRWGHDPFALGAYSYVPVGTGCDEMDVLSQPVENSIFFAGEATHRAYPNTVHGAWLSGIREAGKMLAAIRGHR